MLAFIHHDPPHNNALSIGISTLAFNDNTNTDNSEIDNNMSGQYTVLPCYHRTMYGRWKGRIGSDHANYWPTMIFCPIHTNNDTICDQISQYTGSYTFTMPAGNDYWSNTFEPNRNSLFTNDLPINEGQEYSKNSENFTDATNDLAICLVVPSTSSDVSRRHSFSGMLLECIRYYTSLGFKVLLYDQSGQNQSGLFTDPYHHDYMYPNMSSKISYYNYTIRGAMVREAVEFDNNDLNKAPDAWARMERSDKDKVRYMYSAYILHTLLDILCILYIAYMLYTFYIYTVCSACVFAYYTKYTTHIYSYIYLI